MLCWICKLNPGTTGDHNPKKSDLKAIFGQIDPAKPLQYHHRRLRKPAPITSFDNNRLKSSSLICPECNNARTAPHDKAWEQLARFIRSRRRLAVGQVIKLNQAFPQQRDRQMLNVHLFFCKIFGAKLIESGSPISADSFADAIMNDTPHPHFYLKIVLDNLVGGSDLDTWPRAHDGLVALAIYRYRMDHFSIACIYALPVENWPQLRGAWHPSQKSLKIPIASIASLAGPPALHSSLIMPPKV